MHLLVRCLRDRRAVTSNNICADPEFWPDELSKREALGTTVADDNDSMSGDNSENEPVTSSAGANEMRQNSQVRCTCLAPFLSLR